MVNERLLNRLWSKMKASSKRRGLEFTLGKDEFESLVTSPCSYCGYEGSNQLKYKGETLDYNGLDRIDNELGYESGNLLTSCRFCNSLRGPMKWETWCAFLRGLIQTHGGLEPWWLRDVRTDEEWGTKSFYRHT